MLSLLVSLVTPLAKSASIALAATCDDICRLYKGQAHFAPDTRFRVTGNLGGDAETSTVLFHGYWYLYYRTFEYHTPSGDQVCPYPTGIAVATSSDGNVWTPSNAGLPLSGLAARTSTGVCSGGIANASATFMPYAPSVIVDGSTLRMAYEDMHYAKGGGRTYNEVFVSSSTDALTWSGAYDAVPAGAVGAWDGEVGTPALVKNGSSYTILFHGHDTSRHLSILGLATSATFTGAYSRRQVLQPQDAAQWPNVPSFDYGAGLPAIQGSSDGNFYAIFEGFSGTTFCQKADATPRLVLMRSTDLVSWSISSHAPAQEITKVPNSCGHDLPSWETLATGEHTLITVNDPTTTLGLRLVRWRIVDGAPAGQPLSPPNVLQWGQVLRPGQHLTNDSSGYVLAMQADGNLVLIAPGNRPVWASGTGGHTDAYARIQDDGNLVVYGPNGLALWSTNTYWNIDDQSNQWGGPVFGTLVMQNDGNLVLYGAGVRGVQAYWATGTTTAAITSLASGRCVDADLNTINGNGSAVQLWDCSGQPQQQFSLHPDGSIRIGYNGRCLDADLNTINANGTKVQLWDCNGRAQQRWTLSGDGSIHNSLSGRCLDADLNTINANGTKVQLWDCNGQSQQHWSTRG